MVVTVFSKHASLEVQRFRFNLRGMCGTACARIMGAQASTCVCIMIISPYAAASRSSQRASCYPPAEGLHTHMLHLLAHMSHPLCFNIISQQCASASSCRTDSE